MRRIVTIICFIFSVCLLAPFAVLPSANAAETSSADALVSNVIFHFSVVNYKYTFTVENRTDLDVTAFKIYDYQRMGKTEKGGASDFRSYPVAIGAECAVPAGETVMFEPYKTMWQDCNNVICYVYYIAFSDGTTWGTEHPIVSAIPDYAMKYEVPFKTAVQETTADNLQQGKSSSYNKGIVIFLILIALAVCDAVFYRRKGKRFLRRSGKNGKASAPRSFANGKGQAGEYLSFEQLDLIPGEKRLLHNIYIPKGNGTTTEIDCLLIHTQGLFVIESKDYKGYIYGKYADNQWTQVLRKNKHYTFYNPVLQNAGHIKNLRTYLSYQLQDRYRDYPIYSVVAFSPTADISNVSTVGLPANTAVVHITDIVDTILRFCGSDEKPQYTEEDVTAIYNKLLPCTNVTEAQSSSTLTI